jgi:hypothetical protein
MKEHLSFFVWNCLYCIHSLYNWQVTVFLGLNASFKKKLNNEGQEYRTGHVKGRAPVEGRVEEEGVGGGEWLTYFLHLCEYGTLKSAQVILRRGGEGLEVWLLLCKPRALSSNPSLTHTQKQGRENNTGVNQTRVHYTHLWKRNPLYNYCNL